MRAGYRSHFPIPFTTVTTLSSTLPRFTSTLSLNVTRHFTTRLP
jgi:hypothetical protein